MTTRRVRRIDLSPTMRLHALAGRKREDGLEVVDLSVGEPEFPTPGLAKAAAKAAIDDDRTRYTANEGTLDLREAVCEKLRRDNGLSYAPDEILITSGAKAALFFATVTLFEQGDEVLVPCPYYVSYPEQIRLVDARPVPVPAREANGFKVTPAQLAEAITPRTKGLILNSPNNPTGACYDRRELEELARVCAQRQLWIVADEIYERLVYDGKTFSSAASLGPEIRERTVLVNGVSKAFSMTGWRIGYAAGPRDVIEAMARVQSHCTGNASTIGQWASVEALRSAGDETRRMAAELERRRDDLLRGLAAVPRLTCVPPAGGLSAFPNVAGLCRRAGLRGSKDLARLLLERVAVVVVPGEAFGSDHHIRISFGAAPERIRQGTRRLAEAVRGLLPGS